MFGCHHLTSDLRLKPCLVVIMMTIKLLRTPNLPVPAPAHLQKLGQQRDRRAAARQVQTAPLQPRVLPPLLPRPGWGGRAGPDGGEPAPEARHRLRRRRC